MILESLRDLLVHPAVRSLNVDSPGFSFAHRQILQSKFVLRELFKGFYQECRFMDDRCLGDCPGVRIEIGSGSGFIKEIYPDVITSDLKKLPWVDVILGAENMPFRNNSLRAVYAINVFHHLPDPRSFFKEMLRVIHPGGGIIMIEPYHGCFARWLFKHLHDSERYDPAATTWSHAEPMGPFSNANQALSYIIFERDLATFTREFPNLVLFPKRPHTHLWYLLSGGINFRQLMPDSLLPLVKWGERIFKPFNRWIALQHTIVLRKGD